MLQAGIPVGAGTDATRVASYNPWVALYWLTAGRTVGGTQLYPETNRLDRTEALRRYTVGSAWFSGEEDRKGTLAVGKLADFALLSADYFSVPEEEIRGIESLLTVVDGKVVYGAGPFREFSPPLPPVSPGWSPIGTYGGYGAPLARSLAAAPPPTCAVPRHRPASGPARHSPWGGHGMWGSGCACWAF